MKMKPSVYNFIWPADDSEKIIVFNSLTTALVEIDKTYLALLNIPWFDYETLPHGIRQFTDGLIPGGFLLADEVDELKILKFTYNSNKYDRRLLGLTIAPTLHCNFSCSYCYEQSDENHTGPNGLPSFMPEAVQQELLRFIKDAAGTAKELAVTWYGGEPLLADKIIFGLSEKIIAIAEENKLSYSAGMITNGYLIAGDRAIVTKLKDNKIKYFQITLDGPPSVHNRRRMLKNSNAPTFDRIMEGIKLLRTNEMEVSLRINVDRSNAEAALELLDILESNNLEDISIHLGHVHADTAGCKSIEKSCATMEEFTQLNQHFRETLRLRGFKAGMTPYYPHIAQACIANRKNFFVVDPDGGMYKCWSEIGNKSAYVGNVADFKQSRDWNEWLREVRWLTWEPFEYSDCLDCKVLPICMSGCGYRARFVNGNRPECVEWKYSLEQYIRTRYQHEKSLKTTSG